MNDVSGAKKYSHESLRRRVDFTLGLMKEAVEANDAGMACACASDLVNMVGDSYIYKMPFREIHDKTRDALRDLAPEGTVEQVWDKQAPIMEQCAEESGLFVEAA